MLKGAIHNRIKSMPKLTLIFPRFRYPSGDYPIGVALLAAVVRSELGWNVSICDTTFDPKISTIKAFLDSEQPDYVGVGMSTLMLGEGLEACRLAKSMGCTVFVGGPHPTTAPDELLAHSFIDAVVLGEGELPTIDLLRMFECGNRHEVKGAHVKLDDGTVAYAKGRHPVESLDRLPFPAWDLIDMTRYINVWGQLDSVQPGLRGVNITAARGCPFSCTFCQPVLDAMFGKKLRQRSPQSVIMELKALKAQYDIEAFWFTDDTFTTNRKWVLAFCDALEEAQLNLLWGCTTRANLIPNSLMKRMHSAGLRKLGIGLESATDHIREELYQKGVSDTAVIETVHNAHSVGVQTLLFLMLGAPGENRTDMMQTVELATKLPASEASFSLFVPIPGTDLYQKMIEEGYQLSENYIDYDYYARQPFEHQIARWQLRLIQRYAYLRFYSHPNRWPSMRRIMMSAQGRRSLAGKLKRILPLLNPAT